MEEKEKNQDDELRNLILEAKEKSIVELKKAQELPRTFWETYSSFSNTDGGVVILGVEEAEPLNKIVGVANVKKTLTTLWDTLSNSNKVSYKNIENEDVGVFEIEPGKMIIIINIKEAPDSVKPVFINGKRENAWIRTGDGDRKMTQDELDSFVRNASSSQDSQLLDHFTMDDLDMDSLISFKERVNKRYPEKEYLKMSNVDFLAEIGAFTRDRNTDDFKMKKGTLLFLGKCNSIKEVYPQYHVDYFNRRGDNPRWIDRVTDDEPGPYEMNLYNFYTVVYEKLRMMIQEEFSLDENQFRKPMVEFDEVLREGLVNCLAHADYVQGYPSVRIDAYNGWFSFINPGKMLVSKEQFQLGGDSRPRNEVIMKMFRLLGASERQGFGGPLIYKTACSNNLRNPELETDLFRTELKVWSIDLVESYPDFTKEEKEILRYIMKNEGKTSISAIAKNLNISDYKTRQAISSLMDRKIINMVGSGPTTKYVLAISSVEFLTQMQILMDRMKKKATGK
ncbi:MAG TPA: hypothetical protein DCW44_05175 [Eubacterium sp.]|nr:hypothetical protein [Eubacterium sp.]